MSLFRRRALAPALVALASVIVWGCSGPAPPSPAPVNAFGGSASGSQGGASGSAAEGSSGAAAAGHGGNATARAGSDAVGPDLGQGGAAGAGAPGVGAGSEPGGTGAAGATSPPLGPDGDPTACQAQVPIDPAATQATQLRITLQLAGEPFIFGEPNALPQGGTLIPTNFRFYLSQFAFHQGEQRVAALAVDDQGSPLPYGVALVNTEDAASLQLRLRTLPGTYDGVSFLLGISRACNQAFFPLDPPLDEASQLKWPHALGFLFLRFESLLDDAAVATAAPEAIHMGAAAGPDGQAPRFHFELAEASAESLRLDVAVARVLEAAVTDVDLSDFSLPEPAPPTIDDKILAGERLRRAAVTHEIFTLSPEP